MPVRRDALGQPLGLLRLPGHQLGLLEMPVVPGVPTLLMVAVVLVTATVALRVLDVLDVLGVLDVLDVLVVLLVRAEGQGQADGQQPAVLADADPVRCGPDAALLAQARGLRVDRHQTARETGQRRAREPGRDHRGQQGRAERDLPGGEQLEEPGRVDVLQERERLPRHPVDALRLFVGPVPLLHPRMQDEGARDQPERHLPRLDLAAPAHTELLPQTMESRTAAMVTTATRTFPPFSDETGWSAPGHRRVTGTGASQEAADRHHHRLAPPLEPGAAPVPPGLHLHARLGVLVEVPVEDGRELLVDHGEHDLLVVVERTPVDVGRPGQRRHPVHRDDLRVHHRRLVLVDADPAAEQLVVVPLARQLADPLVGVGPRQQDLHLHAARRRGAEQVDEVRVGREVGGGDPYPLLGGLEDHPQQRLHVLPAETGRTAHHLHHRAAGGRLRGEPVPLVEEVVAALRPVLREGGRHTVHGRAAQPHVGVAPLVLVPGVAAPLLGDPHATREGHLLVHHQDLPVAPVVLLERREEERLAEPRDVHARLVHRLQQVPLDQPAAEAVEEQPHPHPRLGPFAQGGGEVAGDLALPVHEGHEVDGVLGLPYRGQHRGEDLVAVAQGRQLVPLGGGDADQALQPPAQPPPAHRQRLAAARSRVVLGHFGHRHELSRPLIEEGAGDPASCGRRVPPLPLRRHIICPVRTSLRSPGYPPLRARAAPAAYPGRARRLRRRPGRTDEREGDRRWRAPPSSTEPTGPSPASTTPTTPCSKGSASTPAAPSSPSSARPTVRPSAPGGRTTPTTGNCAAGSTSGASGSSRSNC
ncbi:hypothetical protein SFR_5488 [Streptomyces sp. FR-008]|nr:hypothetical protein SFR_5488 [Streptomyces sp. FR-008]